MSIKVKLYGDLKEKVISQDIRISSPYSIEIEQDGIKSILDILNKYNIKEEEISHIFVNGKYCGVGKEVGDGDRVGLFPRRMALMFAEIPNINSIEVTVKLFANLRNYGPAKSIIDVPEGSSVKFIIEKIKIPKDVGNLIILINGIPCHTRDCILRKGDVVAIFPPLAGG